MRLHRRRHGRRGLARAHHQRAPFGRLPAGSAARPSRDPPPPAPPRTGGAATPGGRRAPAPLCLARMLPLPGSIQVAGRAVRQSEWPKPRLVETIGVKRLHSATSGATLARPRLSPGDSVIRENPDGSDGCDHKTPKDPAAFDKHYFEVHVPLAKQLPGLEEVRGQPRTDRNPGRRPGVPPGCDLALRQPGGDPSGSRDARKGERRGRSAIFAPTTKT